MLRVGGGIFHFQVARTSRSRSKKSQSLSMVAFGMGALIITESPPQTAASGD
jgi:hypothetical protein